MIEIIDTEWIIKKIKEKDKWYTAEIVREYFAAHSFEKMNKNYVRGVIYGMIREMRRRGEIESVENIDANVISGRIPKKFYRVVAVSSLEQQPIEQQPVEQKDESISLGEEDKKG